MDVATGKVFGVTPWPRFERRQTEPLGVLELSGGWRLKRYAMNADPTRPVPATLHDAAAQHANTILADVDAGHGVGFMLVHRARPADFILIDWWENGVDLRQRYFRAEHGRPNQLVAVAPGAVGCVWELEIVMHEREAWITHVLAGTVPDYDGYLQEAYRYPIS